MIKTISTIKKTDTDKSHFTGVDSEQTESIEETIPEMVQGGGHSRAVKSGVYDIIN